MVNRSLVFNETIDGDNDRYFCVASNAAGNVNREFQLIVQGIVMEVVIITLKSLCNNYYLTLHLS